MSNGAKKHRIFTAIRLPEKIKKELLSYKKKWPDLPARWVSENNVHITLNFLGYVADEELKDILEAVEDVSRKHSAFYVKMNKICYGPEKKTPPKMVWAKGERSDELAGLKNDLDKALDNYENRGFSPHITLARIRVWDFKKMDQEDIPQIEEDIDLEFEVKSIELMESVLKRGGAEYTILQSFDLNSEK
jgi:2'-5' RNA ligase